MARSSTKKFPGGEVTALRPKISKKYRKIALFRLFQRGSQRKKERKIALLNLYLLLYL